MPTTQYQVVVIRDPLCFFITYSYPASINAGIARRNGSMGFLIIHFDTDAMSRMLKPAASAMWKWGDFQNFLFMEHIIPASCKKNTSMKSKQHSRLLTTWPGGYIRS